MSNNKYKILTVEPNKSEQKSLSQLLEKAGYKVIKAFDGGEAQVMLKSYVPDVIISEMLLDSGGLTLIEKIRQMSDIPIIILSRESKTDLKVAALDAGADDYLTKPYSEAELLARIRVIFRNAYRITNGTNSEFSYRGIRIDYRARRVFVNENEIALTQNEYNILALLTLNSGRMMTYREIIKTIWGDYFDRGSIKKLQVNIANIRKKSRMNNFIINEPGVGYRIDTEQ